MGRKSFKDFLKEKLNIIDAYYDEKFDDAWTFIFNEKNINGYYTCLGMDKIGQWYHSECSYIPNGYNEHLGKKVDLNKLPKNIKNALKAYYEYFKELE